MGIIENNGSFVVNVIKNEKYSCGYGVGINFTFRSTENDLLEYIQKRFDDNGIGSIIKDKTLSVVGEDNLKKLCDFVDNNSNFVSMKRQEEFLAFKKILYLYIHKEHLTAGGVQKIKDIKGK